LGCHKSTISHELKRGTVQQMKSDRTYFEAYFPETGQTRYENNRKACGAKLKLDFAIDFIQFVEKKILDDDWSPDAACGHAKLHNTYGVIRLFVPKPFITILIKGQIAVKNIDLPMKLRRNTKTKRVRKNKRILGQSIEERTSEVEQRQEFGHREIDTVIGKKDKKIKFS